MVRPLLLLLGSLAFGASVHAQSSSERAAVQLGAVGQVSPPSITLSWRTITSTTSIQVFRKLRTATSWGSAIAAPAATASQYVDNTVTPGTAYEYKVVRVSNGVTGTGYISTGIQLPVVDSRGKVLLLVDNTLAAPLSNELAQLARDMKADGWTVLRSDVSPAATVASVRSTVIAQYNTAPADVKALFIVGHVPVPYSGDISPDGHSTHQGAWPCDAYYADVNGTWTDNSVTSTSGYVSNRNIPGDGKFDQSDLPSPVELQVGRVDLGNMPAFPQGAVELTRSYLTKLHNYKVKAWAPQVRGMVFDNLQWVTNPLAASGWRSMAPLVGHTTITAPYQYGTPFKTLINGQSHLWTYSSGGGLQTTVNGQLTFNGADNIGTTEDYAALSGGMDGVFNISFGSYFGDWDNTNNFLRAPLANGDALTNVWSAIPAWYFHHMGMGEPIGTSVLATMNNTGLYTPLTDGWQPTIGRTHLALMGDPTLRQFMVAPPAGLTVTNAAGVAAFAWTASQEAVIGYHLYRIATDGTITRLTTTPVTGTTYQNSLIPFTAGAEYMVRAVKLQTSPSGTYFDLSLGALAVAAGSSSPDCQGVVGGSALPGAACNDGNSCTTNDAWNSNCQCIGTPVSITATITAAGPTTFCAGGSVVLNANTGAGLTYQWRKDGVALAGATTASCTVTSSGSYTVVVTSGGCSETSAATTVTAAQPPTLACSSNATNSTVSVTVTGGAAPHAYAWNTTPVQTTATATVSASGTYAVTVTSGGCVTTCSTAITLASPCQGIRTETQSAWGATATAGTPAAYMTTNFAAAFPAGLTIGCTRKLVLTTAAAVTNFLPSTGPAATLPSGTLTNPTTYSNDLAGQLVAAKLSVRFDELNTTFSPATVLLKDMLVASGTFAGWTVQQVIDEADRKIGSCTSSYTRTALQSALTAINNGYSGGTTNSGYLTCPVQRDAIPAAAATVPALRAHPVPASGPVLLEAELPEAPGGSGVLQVFTASGVMVLERTLKLEEGIVRWSGLWDAAGQHAGLYIAVLILNDLRLSARIVLQ